MKSNSLNLWLKRLWTNRTGVFFLIILGIIVLPLESALARSQPFVMTYLETWSGYPFAADQGLAISDDGQYLFCTGSMGLRKIRLSDRVVMGEISTVEPDATHTGDCGYHNGYVLVPVTNWTPTIVTVRYIKVYDSTLNLQHRFYLERSDWEGEAASIDYDETSGLWWIGDYNTPHVHCYKINLIAGTCQYVESRYIGISAVQGLTWLNGKMYIQSGSDRNIYQFINFVNHGSQYCGGYEGLEALGNKIYAGERHFNGLSDAPIRIYQIMQMNQARGRASTRTGIR